MVHKTTNFSSVSALLPQLDFRSCTMALTASLALVAAAGLFSVPVEAGLYARNSPVLSVTGKTYDRLIAQSNHTTVRSTSSES
jgi:hypothetical protein